ncbi:MAG: SPOR domain-containing protein [Dongiaceae bacterium]
MSSEKPDQIQASVAAALSRLRGDLGPSGATAPKIDDTQMGDHGVVERARPANDVRGDPFFRSIQSPPPGTGMAGRGTIPTNPFPRMQTPQEPVAPEPAPAEESSSTPEQTVAIEMPEMPEPEAASEPVEMLEPDAPALEPTLPSTSYSTLEPSTPPAQPEPVAAAASNPLARMMRNTAPSGATEPAQRDLLSNLPPPPISEPLSADTESGALRRRRRNRRLLAIAAVIVVLAIGAWLWRGSEPSTEVPVVAADTTPEKVKPAEEEGLQVPNQNIQVLDPSQSQGETVMPEPEQPVTPPAVAEMPSAEQAPAVVESTAPDSGTVTAEQAPIVDAPPAPETPLSQTPLPEPEGNAATDTTDIAPPTPTPSAPQPAQAAEAPTASEPAQAQPAPEPAPAQAAAEPAPAPAPAPAPVAAQPEPTQPEPTQAAQPKPAETQEAAVTPTAPAGNTRVQLAAGKSEASVKEEWAALQKAHPDLLGSLTLTIQRVDKGAAGIFYRLQAGPLADKSAAKKLCASLKQKGQDCIVVNK